MKTMLTKWEFQIWSFTRPITQRMDCFNFRCRALDRTGGAAHLIEQDHPLMVSLVTALIIEHVLRSNSRRIMKMYFLLLCVMFLVNCGVAQEKPKGQSLNEPGNKHTL